MTKSEELYNIGTQIESLEEKLNELTSLYLSEYNTKYKSIYNKPFYDGDMYDMHIEGHTLCWEGPSHCGCCGPEYYSISIDRFDMTLEDLQKEKDIKDKEARDKQIREQQNKDKAKQERDYKLYLELKEKFENV